MSQSGNILIDIRSVDEKEDAGIPLLPDMSECLGWKWVWLCRAHACFTGRGDWRSQLPQQRLLAVQAACINTALCALLMRTSTTSVPRPPPQASMLSWSLWRWATTAWRSGCATPQRWRRRCGGGAAWPGCPAGAGMGLLCPVVQHSCVPQCAAPVNSPSVRHCSAMFYATAQPASHLDAPVQLTAVELAALKQLNRGQTLYLLDQSGETAKAGEGADAQRGGGVLAWQWGGEALPPATSNIHFLVDRHASSLGGSSSPCFSTVAADHNPHAPLRPAPAPQPSVARELTKRGFSKVFVVSGGCDAWTDAKLRTKRWEGEGFTTLRAPSALDEIIQVHSCVQRTCWASCYWPTDG